MKPVTYLNKVRRVAAWNDTLEQPRTVKNDHEPYQGIFNYPNGGVFSTNGIVVHIWKGPYDGPTTDTKIDLDNVHLGNLVARIAVSKEHLLRAIKAQRAFKTRTIECSINSTFRMSSKSKFGNSCVDLDNGHVWKIGKKAKEMPVLYRHLGRNYTFHIDPKYIYDAVMGMSDVIVIEVLGNGLKMYSDNTEAWVCFMNPNV